MPVFLTSEMSPMSSLSNLQVYQSRLYVYGLQETRKSRSTGRGRRSSTAVEIHQRHMRSPLEPKRELGWKWV